MFSDTIKPLYEITLDDILQTYKSGSLSIFSTCSLATYNFFSNSFSCRLSGAEIIIC